MAEGSRDDPGRGNREGYDAVAPDYAARFQNELDHKPFDREQLDAFAKRWSERPAGPVLDLGCGPGHVAAYLRERGVEVRGIDLSPGMIACARELYPAIDFQTGDMRALPLPDASLAGIAAFYSLIHIPREDVPAVLGELHRVLRPGGELLVTFHLGSHTLHLDAFFEKPVCMDFHFFERAEMEGWLRDAGLALVDANERDPYPPDVEAQTRRAYLVAQRPHTQQSGEAAR